MFMLFVIFMNITVQCLANTNTSVSIQCGRNEILVKCKTTCPPQSCDISYTEYLCDPNPNPKCEPGCDCIENYLRNEKGECIYNEDCPYPLPSLCGEYEEPIESNTNEFYSNENCKCIDNYVRNSDGICKPALPEPTLVCGYNEKPSNCKQTCPPQTCDFSYDKYACKPGPCQPGCNCIDGYLRNSTGICVPKDQCDSEDYEDCEKANIIEFTTKATASASISSSHASASASSSVMYPSKNATSNSTEYLNCNGDRNATFKECPSSCKSTCKNPIGYCKGSCESSGCQCNPLYVLSDEGKCISPNDCPGGNPCHRNETFIYCKAGCPTNYCPKNDNRGIIACSPPNPCPSGCACKANYKRLSFEDDRCILASECPPVTCTRENEEWNSCPPPCFTERCRDLNQPPRECYRSGPDCQPQCVCKEGYRRNDTDICVPISKC